MKIYRTLENLGKQSYWDWALLQMLTITVQGKNLYKQQGTLELHGPWHTILSQLLAISPKTILPLLTCNQKLLLHFLLKKKHKDQAFF